MTTSSPAATPSLLSVEQHLEQVLDRITPLPAYEHTLADAQGMPLAQDVVSSMSLPVFDNSSMDGYAVRHADVSEAAADRPIHLPVVGEVVAGQSSSSSMEPGTTLRIMTGAPVPPGADAVVPFEWTDSGATTVRVLRAPQEGANIRLAGEDVHRGDVLLRRGDVLGTRQIGLLASVGLARVPCAPRPRVVVMSTGEELVEPGRPLGHDSIYDANSHLLAAAARDAGAVAYRVAAVGDDPDAFAEALSDQLVRADVVVTSGGVSMGTRDVVKEALRDRGLLSFDGSFHGVAMQPGKPQGFGFVGDPGEDRVPIFTLPGNPVSAYVSFQVFVLPALRKMMGFATLSRPLVPAIVTTTLTSERGRRQYLRASVREGAAGLEVTPVGGPGSHLVAGLAGADALALVDADVTRVEAGSPMPVMLLDQAF